ncbi:MAG TPA: translation elongation factor Ts [Candidatus Saccharimonadales bacterium]|nr:translation elongation factor Ts [Candidatus Saccharimonadales bacterium]
MADISVEEIKRLKDLTGVGLTEAKRALVDSNGDFDKALEEMRKKGLTRAEKRGEREAREGLVEAYVHGGRVGVLVELNCETDFVARTDEFKTLAHDLALHIAAMNPAYVSADSIPAAERERKAAEFTEKVQGEGKSGDMVPKIVEGMVKKHFGELCLLEQPFVKDQNKTVNDVIKEVIAKLGENIVVGQMARIELGVVSA